MSNSVENVSQSIKECALALQTKEDFEAWKEKNLEAFLADNSEHEKEFTLDDEDKDTLLRMFGCGLRDVKHADKMVVTYMKKKYGITLGSTIDCYQYAFREEISSLWKELLRMEKDPEYISTFELIFKMWHLRKQVPFAFVDIEKNALCQIIWYHDQHATRGTPQSRLIHCKRDFRAAKEALRKYQEQLLVDESFADSNDEEHLKEQISKAEPQCKEFEEKIKDWIDASTNKLKRFKELMPIYGEHQGLSAFVGEAEEQIAAAEAELAGRIEGFQESRRNALLQWDFRRQTKERAAYEEFNDRLLQLEHPSIYHLTKLERRTSEMKRDFQSFQLALKYFDKRRMENIQREKLNQLYGSSSEGRELKSTVEPWRNSLKFADKYPELLKDQLESIEILKREYKDFNEKKALFEAIIEAEAVLTCVEAPMKEYFAKKEELKKSMDETESDSDESIVKVETPAKDVQAEEPTKAIENHSSWFTSLF